MDYLGIKIFENAYLTEPRTHTWELPRTFEERWVRPVLHPATVPFEPWVKTRLEEITHQVPSEKVIVNTTRDIRTSRDGA